MCHHLLQASRCTVVTSSRRLPKTVKTWLQNSDAEHRVITNRTITRLRLGEKRPADSNADQCLWVQMIFSGMKNQGTCVVRRSRCLVQHFGPAVAFPSIPCPPCIPQSTGARLSAAAAPSPIAENDGMQPPLRQCQRDCLDSCAKGARVIEMACGTGKTRVIHELVSNVSGRVPWAFDSARTILCFG